MRAIYHNEIKYKNCYYQIWKNQFLTITKKCCDNTVPRSLRKNKIKQQQQYIMP